MNTLAKLTGTPSFNPADRTKNVMQAFTDFIETWEMWYDVASIGEVKADATEVERREHKAKVFRMCAFSGERLKVDLKAEYNQDMTVLKAANFDTMIRKLYDRYRPTQKSVLLHYNFISLSRLVRKQLMILSIKSVNMPKNAHLNALVSRVLLKIQFTKPLYATKSLLVPI